MINGARRNTTAVVESEYSGCLAKYSLLDTTRDSDISDSKRARSTVQTRVHNTTLQLDVNHNPDHGMSNKIAGQLNDGQLAVRCCRSSIK